jgi:hypothetical protein
VCSRVPSVAKGFVTECSKGCNGRLVHICTACVSNGEWGEAMGYEGGLGGGGRG